ncbi:helix-turn-helix transcriptional regulator [Streptomyces sp. YC504]|uniref:Helix-turn-helix transcriptional regulator n=1 Tax=Streptomyces mesophilus TaxID=1775132 RepID=A0A6G4XX88_9ACTN|nr:helix-turn-helix transcriptional regulator [Streptomyces mesophilus]
MSPHSRWTTAQPAEAEASEEYDALYEETRLADELGRMVYERRTELGLTQTQLGERAGMTQPQVSRLEGGGTVPTLPLLARLARALDTELSIAFAPRHASQSPEAKLHALGLSVTALREVLDVQVKLPMPALPPMPKMAALSDLTRIRDWLNQAVREVPQVQLVSITEDLAHARAQLEELTAAFSDAEDEARRLEDA